ncbi:bifunctional adenosylcobinamide kinase/adenosylcobinamide-phosphate guanylyltransferase [Variovorax soli]|uniref:bifunctional adenosylcobinamide kinase/adenosylcobinamide-phosphate guanylyltransferase n=2 Tax=Variovorax soli TaxID=376815 RepID=UPI00361B627D
MGTQALTNSVEEPHALSVARRELVLGGQKSGKSRRAEQLAAAWLAQDVRHGALLLATAQAHDAEMRARIERHRADRAARIPALGCVEEPLALAQAVARHSAPHTLLVVDCLTLWLTNRMMPLGPPATSAEIGAAQDELLAALQGAAGPVVLVSNEIGLGVIPLGPEVRGFVDAMGSLNQRVAAVCERVCFMAAGLPMLLKGAA